jgi:phage major head subunit gpT-like protein
MSVVLTQNYLRGLNTGYNTTLQNALKALEGTQRISANFLEETNASGFASMEYNMAAGIPVLKEITGDAQEIQNLTTLQMAVANKPFSRLIGLKREDLERQQGRIYERDITNSAMAYGLFRELRFFTKLRSGFAAASDPARPTEAFFAANKKVAVGKATTFTNLGTKKLSAANFETAVASLRTRKDADGNYLGFGTKMHLLVSPSYESTAQSIVTMDTLAAGGRNPNFGKATLHVCPWLNDSEHNWFLIDTQWVKPAIYQTEVPIASYMQTNPEDSNVMMTGKFLYQLYHRGNCSLSDALCAYGSTGADAA